MGTTVRQWCSFYLSIIWVLPLIIHPCLDGSHIENNVLVSNSWNIGLYNHRRRFKPKRNAYTLIYCACSGECFSAQETKGQLDIIFISIHQYTISTFKDKTFNKSLYYYLNMYKPVPHNVHSNRNKQGRSPISTKLPIEKSMAILILMRENWFTIWTYVTWLLAKVTQ